MSTLAPVGPPRRSPFRLACSGAAALLSLLSIGASAQAPAAKGQPPAPTVKSQPRNVGALTAYGRHFPNG